MDDESSDEEIAEASASSAAGKGPGAGSGGGGGGAGGVKVRHDIYVRTHQNFQQQQQQQQQTGFFKSVKTKYPMFPFHEERVGGKLATLAPSSFKQIRSRFI